MRCLVEKETFEEGEEKWSGGKVMGLRMWMRERNSHRWSLLGSHLVEARTGEEGDIDRYLVEVTDHGEMESYVEDEGFVVLVNENGSGNGSKSIGGLFGDDNRGEGETWW